MAKMEYKDYEIQRLEEENARLEKQNEELLNENHFLREEHERLRVEIYKISKYSDQHQQDCFEKNKLLVTIDTLVERYAALRKDAGMI